MTNHPTRVTDSNTRISLSEGSLNGPCPRDDSGLGWVQIQRKSLLWKEEIEGFSIITHEGLTTLAHPQIGWTITTGMWNTLRTLNMDTLVRIHESCKRQSHLECTDIFTPTRHILQVIRSTSKQIEYMVSQRRWSQSSSRQHPRTMIHGGSHRTRKLSIYGTPWTTKIGKILWQNLRQRAKWTIWKTKDKEWSPDLQEVLRMLGENYLGCTNRDSGITYGGVNSTTTQCRNRCIHR